MHSITLISSRNILSEQESEHTLLSTLVHMKVDKYACAFSFTGSVHRSDYINLEEEERCVTVTVSRTGCMQRGKTGLQRILCRPDFILAHM